MCIYSISLVIMCIHVYYIYINLVFVNCVNGFQQNSVITLSKDVLHCCKEAEDHLTHENEYVEDQNLYRDAVHSCFNLGFEVSLCQLIVFTGT